MRKFYDLDELEKAQECIASNEKLRHISKLRLRDGKTPPNMAIIATIKNSPYDVVYNALNPIQKDTFRLSVFDKIRGSTGMRVALGVAGWFAPKDHALKDLVMDQVTINMSNPCAEVSLAGPDPVVPAISIAQVRPLNGNNYHKLEIVGRHTISRGSDRAAWAVLADAENLCETFERSPGGAIKDAISQINLCGEVSAAMIEHFMMNEKLSKGPLIRNYRGDQDKRDEIQSAVTMMISYVWGVSGTNKRFAMAQDRYHGLMARAKIELPGNCERKSKHKAMTAAYGRPDKSTYIQDFPEFEPGFKSFANADFSRLEARLFNRLRDDNEGDYAEAVSMTMVQVDLAKVEKDTIECLLRKHEFEKAVKLFGAGAVHDVKLDFTFTNNPLPSENHSMKISNPVLVSRRDGQQTDILTASDGTLCDIIREAQAEIEAFADIAKKSEKFKQKTASLKSIISKCYKQIDSDLESTVVS